MRLLLDTHALVWAILAVGQLSAAARTAIASPAAEVRVSVASVWEIAIKVGLGKWPQALPLLSDIETRLAVASFTLLPLTIPHVRAAGLMQSPHRDPFDRLLAAQAIAEGLTLVTADTKVQSLGARWVW